jgi:hypothetical protein
MDPSQPKSVQPNSAAIFASLRSLGCVPDPLQEDATYGFSAAYIDCWGLEGYFLCLYEQTGHCYVRRAEFSRVIHTAELRIRALWEGVVEIPRQRYELFLKQLETLGSFTVDDAEPLPDYMDGCTYVYLAKSATATNHTYAWCPEAQPDQQDRALGKFVDRLFKMRASEFQFSRLTRMMQKLKQLVGAG